MPIFESEWYDVNVEHRHRHVSYSMFLVHTFFFFFWCLAWKKSDKKDLRLDRFVHIKTAAIPPTHKHSYTSRSRWPWVSYNIAIPDGYVVFGIIVDQQWLEIYVIDHVIACLSFVFRPFVCVLLHSLPFRQMGNKMMTMKSNTIYYTL